MTDPNHKIQEVSRQGEIIDFNPHGTLIKAQHQIGWKQLRHGRWSQKWVEYQFRY